MVLVCFGDLIPVDSPVMGLVGDDAVDLVCINKMVLMGRRFSAMEEYLIIIK